MALPKYRRPRGWRKDEAEERRTEKAKSRRSRKDEKND